VRGQTEPRLVALYDIRPRNGAGLFFQPRSLRGAYRWQTRHPDAHTYLHTG